MKVDTEEYPVAEAEEKKPPIPLNADKQASAARLSSDVPGGEAVLKKKSLNGKLPMLQDIHRLASDQDISYVNWDNNGDVVFHLEPFEAYMKKHQLDCHYSPTWIAFHKLLDRRGMNRVEKTWGKRKKTITATYSHELFKPDTYDDLDSILPIQSMQVDQADYVLWLKKRGLLLEVDQGEETVTGA